MKIGILSDTHNNEHNTRLVLDLMRMHRVERLIHCGDITSPHIVALFEGWQVDFVRGAARSKGGKPIIALPSTAKNDSISRITWQLTPGAGVVTTRNDVHYVVTEYGVAYLHGKSIRERAQALIGIAHPKFRDELEAKARELNYIPKQYVGVGPEETSA